MLYEFWFLLKMLKLLRLLLLRLKLLMFVKLVLLLFMLEKLMLNWLMFFRLRLNIDILVVWLWKNFVRLLLMLNMFEMLVGVLMLVLNMFEMVLFRFVSFDCSEL